ncbi:MAG: PEGA domain-containing protein [Deltaproteobacteria bacterium]|nr:PEGA domain-containing protein [Deltaproteobacteria bacterium]
MARRGKFLFLLLAMRPIAAWAEDPPVEDATTMAAEAFERGKRAFEEDDYVGALSAFEEAQRLRPHDVVRFNIGLCQERLGHFALALASYRHAADSSQLDEATRADADERARRVAGRLGRLSVPEPRGARVAIDGAQRCVAPCTVDLDPGSHQVRVEGGGTTIDRPVRIERGQTALVGERAADPAPARASRERDPAPDRFRIGVVGWIGAGVAVLGGAGTLLFGLRATSLHRSYLEEPNRSRLDDGRAAVLLTNVSIVTALVGAATFVLDVFVLEPWTVSPDRAPP